MAGIDLTGKDPFASFMTGASGSDPISDLLGGASIAALDPTGGYLSLGLKLLSGNTDKSGTVGAADTLLNTSGYVVGEGDALGGGLDSSRGAIGFAWPWWYWAAGSLVAIAIIKKVV